jgi:hypothetical protein
MGLRRIALCDSCEVEIDEKSGHTFDTLSTIAYERNGKVITDLSIQLCGGCAGRMLAAVGLKVMRNE